MSWYDRYIDGTPGVQGGEPVITEHRHRFEASLTTGRRMKVASTRFTVRSPILARSRSKRHWIIIAPIPRISRSFSSAIAKHCGRFKPPDGRAGR